MVLISVISGSSELGPEPWPSEFNTNQSCGIGSGSDLSSDCLVSAVLISAVTAEVQL